MTARELLTGMASLRVLIVGDLCLDQWCHYDPKFGERSAETGIPRLAVTRTEFTPGAGGTVAANLRALGVEQVSVLGIVGEDGHGFELLRALTARNISTELVWRESKVPTFTYSKLINVSTQIEDQARVDFIFTGQMPPAADEAICSRLREYAHHFDVICVSDQAETESGGVITANVRNELKELARQGAFVWVDSRKRIELFRNAVLKVNEEEERSAFARTGWNNVRELRDRTDAPMIFVTCGGDGVRIATKETELRIPTRRISNPVDICGAGDSFSAGASCALALGADPEHAVRLGHLVASVTIMKKGTGTASPGELLEAERNLASY
jgi:rfaE bifunctional protein kinase chain/domain